MPYTRIFSSGTVRADLTAGLVVFLVALPLCLGVALASNAPLVSGVLAGVLGGVVVGALSGSQTSVSGTSAGLTTVVAAQIKALGTFEAFLLAVIVAGAIQIILGLLRAGFLSDFVPSGVVKGLLAAIGLILVLKQIPHLLGHDTDPEGEFSFVQPDHENTFSEFGELIGDMHLGAATIGLLSIALLILAEKWPRLKKSPIPTPLWVVALGVGLGYLFERFGGRWAIGGTHLVQVPVAESLADVAHFLRLPDFTQWKNPAVYSAGLLIAAVASLETLLNLEAVDKLDPRGRKSPPSRELLAQGTGNLCAGLLGGLPISSVIVRSSVNINSGSRTQLATIVHGLLLLGSVLCLPMWLNRIPLSCLAAILIVTGIKLASVTLLKQMWQAGRYQFIPFAATVSAIVLTDLLRGVLIGLAISVAFILNSSLRRPLRRIVEKHLGGDVLHIELANQVSFLNKAALAKVLDQVPRGGHVLIDARQTDYIDPDVLELLHDFHRRTGPVREVKVSLQGFRHKYALSDEIQYVDYSTRSLQARITPAEVLQILLEGNRRFRTGQRLTRDLARQVSATAQGQHPLAVVLSCIDSRTPAELIFDLGVGDIFSVRIAGNVVSPKVLGSMEYGCAVAGAKLVLVMGHTRCGAVTAAVQHASNPRGIAQATGCDHLEYILADIQQVLDPPALEEFSRLSSNQAEAFVNGIARENVLLSVATILSQSPALAQLQQAGQIAIVGAMYDVASGEIIVLSPPDEVAAASPATSPQSAHD